jgi:hypothetical protein
MDAVLEIRDGDPFWWNSPDIWVVPGNDPNGMPGQPIEGESAFLWVKIQNAGELPIRGAQVNFYWSNPAVFVLRSNSTLIGSSFVDFNSAESKEVLCVIPWIPVIVNDGHECIIVEVIHPSITIDSTNEFDPPNPKYHNIAQKNLSVLKVNKSRSLAIQTAAPIGEDKVLHIEAVIESALSKENLIQLGLDGYECDTGGLLEFSLSLEPGYDDILEKRLQMQLKQGTTKVVYLKVSSQGLKPQTYVPLHVIAYDQDKKNVGGITYLVVN